MVPSPSLLETRIAEVGPHKSEIDYCFNSPVVAGGRDSTFTVCVYIYICAECVCDAHTYIYIIYIYTHIHIFHV